MALKVWGLSTQFVCACCLLLLVSVSSRSFEDGHCVPEDVNTEDGRSFIQRGVRASIHQSSPFVPDVDARKHRIENMHGQIFENSVVGRASVSASIAYRSNVAQNPVIAKLGTFSDAGLRKFWAIALSSYVISLACVCAAWWFFFMPKTPPEESSDEEDTGPMMRTSSQAIAQITTPAPSEEDPAKHGRHSWKAGTAEERLRIGSLTSLIISCTMSAYALLRFVHRPACSPFQPYVHIPEMFVLLGLVGTTGCCWMRPKNYLYWPALALILLYIPAVALPPFNMSCAMLQSTECRADGHWRISQAVNHVDCSLQGQTAQQIFLTTFLLLPWLLPEMKFLYLMFGWIFSVYIVWSVAYFRYSEDTENSFDAVDVVSRAILLTCTLMAAILKKYYVQKSQENKYATELAQMQLSLRLYNILEFMLPEHVILRMLMEPGEPIADSVPEASILFIVIDDFESIVRNKRPELLLRFLNQYFTKFDAICHHYHVTKIETVGEEYVCCVGVTPLDQEENASCGHSSILRRLLKAANAIMQLQDDTVKFKMGIHTGPIVAGVIAQKLPRFRLFGDTINTAARMMQKGEVGLCQFGEETQRLLPADMQTKPRGEVEMKGKGLVKTFLFGSPSIRDRSPSVAAIPMTPSANKRGRVQIDNDDVAESERDPESGSEDGGGLLEALLKPKSKYNADSNPLEASDITHGTEAKKLRRSPDSQSQFTDIMNEIRNETNRKAAGILSSTVALKNRRWILSEKAGFTDDMEKEFLLIFLRDHACKKITQRLDSQIILLLILSVVEFLWNVPSPHRPELGWAQEHDMFAAWARSPIFVGSRAIAVAIMLAVRSSTGKNESVRSNPQLPWVFVASSSSIIVLIYLSYDVMITGQEGKGERSERVLAPFDQIFSSVFLLLFFFICSLHKVLFMQSAVFIPLALLIVALTNVRSQCGVYFPIIGQVLFVFIAVSFTMLAHSEEQTLRARYKTQHATQTTNERVEAILKTMMPPMVLDEVQKMPPGTLAHHQYDNATIAQSDLCGFTKIAAGLKPTEVVKFISDLFGLFDKLTDDFGVYKVETVGDAYIGGQAEAPLTVINSPSAVVQFGIAMVHEVTRWSKRLGVDVCCRVGVHSGSCIGGIVDKEMQRYHMFGPLMQMLEILESTAPEGGVQVSAACRDAVFEERQRKKQTEKPELVFKERDCPHLITSKGEVHDFGETGGRTSVIEGPALILKL